MNYDYTKVDYSKLVHTLSVTGPIKTDAAKLLIDCEEALSNLGYNTTLQIAIWREAFQEQKKAIEEKAE